MKHETKLTETNDSIQSFIDRTGDLVAFVIKAEKKLPGIVDTRATRNTIPGNMVSNSNMSIRHGTASTTNVTTAKSFSKIVARCENKTHKWIDAKL